jgi:uncharacterized protein with von Willebrand factor type A (vWA) domain
MLPALTGFFDALRARGVSVAPSAAIDAVRALAAVGVESRAAVRAALRLTCSKDARERALLDEEFARYFAAPGHLGGGRPAEDGAGTGGGAGRGEPAAETATCWTGSSERAFHITTPILENATMSFPCEPATTVSPSREMHTSFQMPPMNFQRKNRFLS